MEVLVSSHGGTHSFPVALDACHHAGMLGGLLASVEEETGFGRGEFHLRAPATGTLLRTDSDLVALCDGDLVEAVQSDASSARQELADRGIPATPATLSACAAGRDAGDVEKLRLLVRAGVRVAPDSDCLVAAVAARQGAEVVALLLEAGASANTVGPTYGHGRALRPLEAALSRLRSCDDDTVVAALLHGGAQPTATSAFLAVRKQRWDALRAIVAVPHCIELAKTGFISLLRDAAERGAPTAVIEELLAGGAPFAPGGMGGVCAAARWGNDDTLRLLLKAARNARPGGERGGLPGAIDPTGTLRAAQRLAARGGNVACVEMLREACAAGGAAFEAGALLAVAVRARQADVVRHLMAQRSGGGGGGGDAAVSAAEETQALLWAVRSPRTDVAHLLLDCGVRLDAAGASVACDIVAAATFGSDALLRRLLDAAGGARYVVRRGRVEGGVWCTALFAAVSRDQYVAAVRLLDAVGGGAAAAELASVVNPMGETCLHVASRRGYTTLLRLLLDAVRGEAGDDDADGRTAAVRRMLEARSHAGDTVLSAARPAGECAALLLAEGAEPSPAVLPTAQHYVRTGQLQGLLSLLDRCRPSGPARHVPVVARAARDGDGATLRLLAACGFSLTAGIAPDGSPLCAAATGARDESTVAALLELGADPNKGRGCALVCALRVDNAYLRYQLVSRLLDAGACPNGAPYTPATWRPFDLPVTVAAALPDGHDVLDLLLAHPRLDISRTVPPPRGVRFRSRLGRHPTRAVVRRTSVDAVQSLANRGFVGSEQAFSLMRLPSLVVTSATLESLAAVHHSTHAGAYSLLAGALLRVSIDARLHVAEAEAAAAAPPPPRPPIAAAAPPLSKRRLTRRGGPAAAASVPPPPPPQAAQPVSEAERVASVVCGRAGVGKENALHAAVQARRPEAVRMLLDSLEDASVPFVPLRAPAAARRRTRRRRVRNTEAAAAATAATLGVQFGHGHGALCAALAASRNTSLAPVLDDLLQKPRMGFWLDATLCSVAFGQAGEGGGVPESPLLSCTAPGDLKRVLAFAAMCLGWHGLLGDARAGSCAGSLAACGLGAETVPTEALPARFLAYVRVAERQGVVASSCRWGDVQDLDLLRAVGVGVLHATAHPLHAAVSRSDAARPEVVSALLAAVRDEAAAKAAERGASSSEAEQEGRRAAAAYASVRDDEVSVLAAVAAASNTDRREDVLWRLLDAVADLSEEEPVVLMGMCRRDWLHAGVAGAVLPTAGVGQSPYDLHLVHRMLVRGARLSTTEHFCGEAERLIRLQKKKNRAEGRRKTTGVNDGRE